MMKIPSLFLCLSLMMACNTPEPKEEWIEDLKQLYTQEFEAEGPGGSVLVKKGEAIVFLESYGLSDLESREKITENTIFNTGSISKTFVSNGILMLHEKGLLSIEDDLHQYFKDFKKEEIAKKVKIKHLLNHSSGLIDLRGVGDSIDFYLSAKDQENFNPIKQADSLFFQPGERFQYSNPAYNGLALIIEKVTGQPWQSFIKENIFEIAGMSNSKITNGPYPQEDVAHGYVKWEGVYREADYGEIPTFAAAGNSGVWSTVLDLVKYEEAIQKHAFLGESLTQESRTVYKPKNWSDTIPPFLGYSWFLGESYLFKGQRPFKIPIIYHTGSQGGFHSFYVLIPDKKIHLIGLFNTPLSDRSKVIEESLSILERENWLD